MVNDVNPDLDAIADEVAETLTSKQSEAEETEATETEAPEEKTEEVEKTSEEEPKEETEESEAEETFAEKQDLNGKSPEELEQIYRDWNKAYTQKRQQEREEMKRVREELAQLKTKVPQEQEKPLNQMTPQELQEHFARQAQEMVKNAKENSYIESQEKAFYELDPRLNEDDPNYDEYLFYGTAGKVSQLREQYEAEHGTVVGFDFVGEAKRQIDAYDKAVQQRLESKLKRQEEIARKKTEKFNKSNPKPKAGKTTNSSKMDLDDAFSEALTEVGGTFSW